MRERNIDWRAVEKTNEYGIGFGVCNGETNKSRISLDKSNWVNDINRCAECVVLTWIENAICQMLNRFIGRFAQRTMCKWCPVDTVIVSPLIIICLNGVFIVSVVGESALLLWLIVVLLIFLHYLRRYVAHTASNSSKLFPLRNLNKNSIQCDISQAIYAFL